MLGSATPKPVSVADFPSNTCSSCISVPNWSRRQQIFKSSAILKSSYFQEGTRGSAHKIFELVFNGRVHGCLDSDYQGSIVCENDCKCIITLASDISEILQEARDIFGTSKKQQCLIHGMAACETGYNANSSNYYCTTYRVHTSDHFQGCMLFLSRFCTMAGYQCRNAW